MSLEIVALVGALALVGLTLTRRCTSPASAEVHQRLEGCSSLPEAGRVLLDVLSLELQAQTAAIFLEAEGDLLPTFFRGPQRERFEQSRELKLEEPAVSQAWESGRLTAGHFQASDSRISREPLCLAAPMGQLGVVFMGRDQQDFSTEERARFQALAGQATELFERLHRNRLHNELAEQSAASRKLSLWMFRFDHQLEAAQEISSAESEPEAIESTRLLLEALAPHQLLLLFRRDPEGWVLEAGPEPYPKVFQKAANQVVQSQRPFLLGSPESKHLNLPAPYQSLFACPVLGGRVLILAGEKQQQFDAEQVGLVKLSSQQLGATLERFRLGREYTRATKMAALGQMAAGLSHELNTPLAVCRLALESATESVGQEPTKALQQLEAAGNALERVELLVSSLVSFGFAEPTGVRLDEIVKNAMNEFEQDFEFEQRGTDFNQIGNGPALQAAVHAILKNALEACGEAAQVRVLVDSSGADYLIEVHDNGPGIDPEIRDRVTEPFFTTRTGKNPGMGLAVAERVIRDHRGELDFLDSPLGGALARIRLPRA